MKRLNYLLSAVVVSIVLATTGCGNDDGGGDPPQPSLSAKEVKVIEKLSNEKKKWELGKVTVGEVALSDMEMKKLEKFHIIFDDKKGAYTTNGNVEAVTRKPNPWPASGTWKFKDKITDENIKQFKIIRGDQLEISVKLDAEYEALTLTFDLGDGSKYKTSTGKKVTTTADKNKVKGKWVMTFKKEGVALKEAKERLFKTWKGSTPTILEKPGSIPEIVDFSKLEVTFAKEGTYTTNGDHEDVARKPNPWPASGNWAFKDEDAITAATGGQFVIIIDDQLEINAAVGDDKLVLIFTFDETKHKTNQNTKLTSSNTSGIAKVKGKWTISFAPKPKP